MALYGRVWRIGDVTANTFTSVKVIRKVPGFGGTIASPWAGGEDKNQDEQSCAELVGAWSRDEHGGRGGPGTQ